MQWQIVRSRIVILLYAISTHLCFQFISPFVPITELLSLSLEAIASASYEKKPIHHSRFIHLLLIEAVVHPTPIFACSCNRRCHVILFHLHNVFTTHTRTRQQKKRNQNRMLTTVRCVRGVWWLNWSNQICIFTSYSHQFILPFVCCIRNMHSSAKYMNLCVHCVPCACLHTTHMCAFVVLSPFLHMFLKWNVEASRLQKRIICDVRVCCRVQFFCVRCAAKDSKQKYLHFTRLTNDGVGYVTITCWIISATQLSRVQCTTLVYFYSLLNVQCWLIVPTP